MVLSNCWVVWQCSASCGAGVKRRELHCGEKDSQGGYTEFPVRRCRHLQKPEADLEQSCNNAPCPEPLSPQLLQPGGPSVTLGWYSSPWLQVCATSSSLLISGLFCLYSAKALIFLSYLCVYFSARCPVAVGCRHAAFSVWDKGVRQWAVSLTRDP